MNSVLTQNISAQDWLLRAGLQPGATADRGRESTTAEAKQELHTQLGFPLLSLPPAHGTIQHLPGPDSSFPDYLLLVVVGNEKRKMFISPKQHETLNIKDCRCLWPQTE